MGTTDDTDSAENAEKSENERRCGHRLRSTGKPHLLHEELTGVIRQTAFAVHRYFGCGFLEKAYENALAKRLRKQGRVVASQAVLRVKRVVR